MSDTQMFRSVALADVVDPDTYRAEMVLAVLGLPWDTEAPKQDGTERV